MAAKPAKQKTTAPTSAPNTLKGARPSVLTKPKPAASRKSKAERLPYPNPITSGNTKGSTSSKSGPPPSNLKPSDGQLALMPKTPGLPLPIDEEFHKNIVELAKRTDQPCAPQCYRSGVFPRSNSYILLHEEEQHLADQVAFLAQTKSGPEVVSAVTLEECHRPPSLTFRLASNRLRQPEVVEGLREILKVVEEYSLAGMEFLLLQTNPQLIHEKYRNQS